MAVGGEVVTINNVGKRVSKIDTASLSLSPFGPSKPMSQESMRMPPVVFQGQQTKTSQGTRQGNNEEKKTVYSMHNNVKLYAS